jgi:hypothetical protein
MRLIIKLVFLFLFISQAFSQRLFFHDPDLSFSFKKPKKWKVIDDGYVVKVMPSLQDSAKTYLTLTYFEDAQPFGGLTENDESPNDAGQIFKKAIAGEKTFLKADTIHSSLIRTFTFEKYGQRFELIIHHPLNIDKSVKRKLDAIIYSIRVSLPEN